jgi:hypothetical protein
LIAIAVNISTIMISGRGIAKWFRTAHEYASGPIIVAGTAMYFIDVTERVPALRIIGQFIGVGCLSVAALAGVVLARAIARVFDAEERGRPFSRARLAATAVLAGGVFVIAGIHPVAAGVIAVSAVAETFGRAALGDAAAERACRAALRRDAAGDETEPDDVRCAVWFTSLAIWMQAALLGAPLVERCAIAHLSGGRAFTSSAWAVVVSCMYLSTVLSFGVLARVE